MVKVRELIVQNRMLPVGMGLLVLSFILSMITVMPTHVVVRMEKNFEGAQTSTVIFTVPGYPTQSAQMIVNISAIRGNGRITLRIYQSNSTTPWSLGPYFYNPNYHNSWRFSSSQLSEITKVEFLIIPSSYSVIRFHSFVEGYFYLHDYLLWISVPSFIVGLGAFFVGLFRAVVALARRERERKLR